jgi:DNA-binding MarR family transcriptional regulator
MPSKLSRAREIPVTRSLTDAEDGLVAPALMIAANLIRRAGNLTYKTQLGLPAIEWALMARLGKDGPMTQTALAEMVLYDKGQISRATGLLERKRLIARRDLTWRSVELSLTPSGVQVYNAIMRISRERQEAFTRNVGAPELRQFYETLNTIAGNASDLLSRLRSKDGLEEE